MEVKNLEKKAKNEILKQFDADELMEEIIRKTEPRKEKVIIENWGD